MKGDLTQYIIKDSIHKDTMMKMVRDYYKTKIHRLEKLKYTRLKQVYKIGYKIPDK